MRFLPDVVDKRARLLAAGHDIVVHLTTVKLDDLLYKLEAFADPPAPRASACRTWAGDEAELARLWLSALPVTEIARRLNRTFSACVARAYLLDLPPRIGSNDGRTHWAKRARLHNNRALRRDGVRWHYAGAQERPR